MNRIVATMDDLPELPFEKVLSYLSLEDRLKARAVSRRWYHQINRFRVKSLCCSERPLGFIYGKSRLVNDAFAQDFIWSRRFDSFFNTFAPTILSGLQQLRLCHLDLEVNGTEFTRTLNSFGRLEELTLFSFELHSGPVADYELNLPMLVSLQFEIVSGFKKLTLDAPMLRKIRLMSCDSLYLVLVHNESVERIHIDWLEYTEVEYMNNLQHLYAEYDPGMDETFLSELKQLKTIHLKDRDDVQRPFEQKQRYGRVDLKIYLCGYLLSGPDDPAMRFLSSEFCWRTLEQLAKNPSRLADEIPFCESLIYENVKEFDPKVAIDLVSRFTNLEVLYVFSQVDDIERFLSFLKNCSNTWNLWFDCEQPQELFNRLPGHCTVQSLYFKCYDADLNFEFLFRLKHLIDLQASCGSYPIDAELIRKLFEGLPFLSRFACSHRDGMIRIEVTEGSKWTHPKQFLCSTDHVWSGGNWTEVPDLEAVIQLFMESVPQTD